MEVGLHEVVVRRVVCQLPRTHSMSIKGVTHIHFQMTTFIDIYKDITGLIAAVPLHIMLNGLGAKGLIVCIGKCQYGTLGLVYTHSEVTGLCQTAILPCTIVILLRISQVVGIFLVAAFVLNCNRLNWSECHKMAELHT